MGQSETHFWAPVRSYLLHSFLQVHTCAAPFTSHGNQRSYAEPKPFSWPKLAYVGFSSSNFNVQNRILSTPGDALTTMVHLRTKPNRKLYILIAYHLSFVEGWWVWKQSCCHSLWVPTLYQCWVGTNPWFRTGPGFNLVVSKIPSGYNSSDNQVDTLPIGYQTIETWLTKNWCPLNVETQVGCIANPRVRFFHRV
jgi:hypothetical protein